MPATHLINRFVCRSLQEKNDNGMILKRREIDKTVLQSSRSRLKNQTTWCQCFKKFLVTDAVKEKARVVAPYCGHFVSVIYDRSKRLGNLQTPLEQTQRGTAAWGLYHKTYYGHNLRISVMSQSVCPWQAFPVQSSVCR